MTANIVDHMVWAGALLRHPRTEHEFRKTFTDATLNGFDIVEALRGSTEYRAILRCMDDFAPRMNDWMDANMIKGHPDREAVCQWFYDRSMEIADLSLIKGDLEGLEQLAALQNRCKAFAKEKK